MKRFYKLISLMCLALWATALSAQSHWSFDYKQYQYDMTVYFQLQDEDEVLISNTDNYQVAAFIGDECCGVGEFLTVDVNDQPVKYGYLRVYSNNANGGKVTFKAYDKANDQEIALTPVQAVTFASQGVVGVPSSPLGLSLSSGVLVGDVNGDGEIDLTDVVLIFDFFMGEDLPDFIEAAADFNSDGDIDLTDVVLVFDYFMNQ